MNEAATILPNMKVYPIRLLPGQDLIKQLHQTAVSSDINAGWILSAVGSLTKYYIRFANQSQPAIASGHFEILALNGIVSDKGCHLHIMISDENGNVRGGHVLSGCIIYTTVEIIIGYTDGYTFDRAYDSSTGYKELAIVEKPTQ